MSAFKLFGSFTSREDCRDGGGGGLIVGAGGDGLSI